MSESEALAAAVADASPPEALTARETGWSAPPADVRTGARARRGARLGAEAERALARCVQLGDAKARTRLVEANLGLVHHFARRYVNRGLPHDDLVEEGNLGLLRAVDRFDPERGCRFSTHAAWWIREAIERALANQSRLVRLPVHVGQAVAACRRAQSETAQVLLRAATSREAAAAKGMPLAEFERLRAIGARADAADHALASSAHLDPQIDDGGDPIDVLARRRLAQALRESLDALDARDREIVCRRFGLEGYEPQSLEEVGRAVSLARERVRQLQLRAVGLLRTRLGVSRDDA